MRSAIPAGREGRANEGAYLAGRPADVQRRRFNEEGNGGGCRRRQPEEADEGSVRGSRTPRRRLVRTRTLPGYSK